jgi:hypothetical protein
MFAGLRHHAFICCYHEEYRINPPYPGEHILDEVAMTGNIHDTHFLAIRQRKPGEAKVNRHLALALFFQPVGVNAGERFDQRGFAVINMAGGANNVHLL